MNNNNISRFNVCVLVDMWAPNPEDVNFLTDNAFRNHFVQKYLLGRAPIANQYISSTRRDPIDPLIWSVISPSKLVVFPTITIERLEEHKFLKSKQDNICIIGQHSKACLLYSNLGIVSFLQRGYENVYTDISLNNPQIHLSDNGLLKKHDFIFEDPTPPAPVPDKTLIKIQYEYMGSTIFKLKLLEDKNENTDSRE